MVPGGVDFSRLTSSGRLVLYRNGDYLRVFSAATGRWDAFTPSFGTTPLLKRDMLLVPESDRWTAYSAYRGAFAVKLLNLAASTMTATDSCAVVQEGALVHAYSAFTGDWVTRSLPAGWTVVAGNRIVVIADTTSIACTGASAFDVFRGQWIDLPARPERLQPPIVVSGSTAVLDFTTYLAGCSALHPNWITHPMVGTIHAEAQGAVDADFVVMRGELFSGLAGTFNPSPVPPMQSAVHEVDGLIGRCRDGTNYWFCSAAHNTWTQMPVGTQAFVASGSAVQLFTLGGQAWAYSSVTDTAASSGLPYGSGISWGVAVSGATAAAAAYPPNQSAVFSAMTGLWYPAPGPGSSLPALTQSGALVARTGFSSHTGQFVAPPAIGNGINPLAGGVLELRDSSAVYVFDPRRVRWLSQPLHTATAQNDIRHEVLIAADATHAIAFGEGSGRFESMALPEPALALWADRDVGVVRTANHVLAFAGLPDSLLWSTFPTATSAVTTNTTLFHQLWLPGGSIAILGVGPRAAVPAPLPFGLLWLEPTVATFTYLMSAPPGESRALLTLPIPDLPGLRNSEWLLQALVLPTSGDAWLGDADVLRVL